MISCYGCKHRNCPQYCACCVGWNNYESNTLINPVLATDIDKEMKMLAKLRKILGVESSERRENNMKIKKVIFNDPVTVVLWEDGAKTIVKCDGEKYDPEKGLAMAIAKKALGNKGNYYEVFKKWLPEENGRTSETIKSELTINGNGELKLSVETKVCKVKTSDDNETKEVKSTSENGPTINSVTLREYCVMNNYTKNKVYGMIKRNEVDAYKDDRGYWRINISK